LRPGEYQRVGNLIEQPEKGAVYGQGRMLSTGNMASSLHPKEVDPDVKPKPVAAPPEEKIKTPEDVNEAEPPADREEAPKADEGEELEEFEEDLLQ
jgi:hypothetical protein